MQNWVTGTERSNGSHRVVKCHENICATFAGVAHIFNVVGNCLVLCVQIFRKNSSGEQTNVNIKLSVCRAVFNGLTGSRRR